ncbi:MAG: hypothetical protein H7Z16_06940 [Pyrinomonadaceae bacterium]|nr:hypothetical protein [Pyrinomonadaceae bacterium]
MITKLDEVLRKIISLLRTCGVDKNAEWFEDRKDILARTQTESPEFQQTLLEIRNVIAGMGSFSDLSLIPLPSSGVTKDDAGRLQWDLAEELDEVIAELLQR